MIAQSPFPLKVKVSKTILVACLLLFVLISNSGLGIGQKKGRRKCATDPTYRYFEEEQQREYEANPAAREILLNTNAMREASERVSKALQGRPDSIGLGPSITDKDSERIDKELAKLKLPTCYENPAIYYMIKHYVGDVERARTQLKLPLRNSPKYGSLPTNDINAYTYPADPESKRGSIIGFNVKLFMFAYQMLKVTLPTIEVDQDPISTKVRLDTSRGAAIRAVGNPEIRTNFVTALLEFLQLTSSSTQPLDRKYDSPLMSLTVAIELFAVAHEYGHLIKGHSAESTMRIQLMSSDDGSQPATTGTLVAARSWQQELEADRIGLQLVAQVLKNRILEGRDEVSRGTAQLRQLDSFFGALFFFKCVDVVDKAKYIKRYGKPQPPPSTDEADYVRALADGRATTEQQVKFAEIKAEGHPPAWLRLERAIEALALYLHQEDITEEAKEYAQIGGALVRNVDILWDASLPRLPTIIQAVQQNKVPGEIGYVISPRLWAHTFLYNPALQEAVAMFRDRNAADADVVQQYLKAIKQDWLLLSGLQVRWAEAMVADHDATKRREALAVLALSGDLQALPVLKRTDVSAWDNDDRALLTKVQQFLGRNGRDTSVAVLERVPAMELKLTDLLCYPAQLDKLTSIENLVPSESPRDVSEFIRSSRAVAEGRSLSSMAIYMLHAKTDAGTSYGFWADLLLQAEKADAALSYAQAGVSKAGPTASLENTIGNILSAKGDLRAAIPHYEASLRLGRVDGWPEVNMAKNFADLGELKQAEQWFRRAVERRATARSEGEYARYLNEFAWFLATKFKADAARAKEALSLSLESNQITRYSNPNYIDTLAECQAANGDLVSAVKSSRAALALLPKDSPEREHYVKRLAEFESRKGN